MSKQVCDVKDCARKVEYLCARCGHSLCQRHAHHGIIKYPCPKREYKPASERSSEAGLYKGA